MENEISYKELYETGDRLILKLYTDDIFEGDVSDVGTNRIELRNAKQHNNKNALTGVYSFYRNEIDTLQKLKTNETEKPNTPQKKSTEECFEKIQLTDSEYDRLKEMSQEYVYIDKPDSRYFQAIELLSRAETVGIVGLGIEKNRSGSIKLLGVSVWDRVYLIDLVNQKQSYFYPEIKVILESEYTCKVVHEAGPLLDILYRKYNVYTKNVFDTQIVDLVIKKKETGNVPICLSDISDIITDYLHFPSSYLQKALETTHTKWGERPLSDRRKGYAAQLVTYLIVLRDYMQKKLFTEVYEAIEKVHDHYYYLDCYQFSKNWQSKEVPKEIQNMIPNLATLDKSTSSKE